MKDASPSRLTRLWPMVVFVAIFVGHALYIGHEAASPSDGWADSEIIDYGFLGLKPYWEAQDYFLGFSYALGAAFAVWAIGQFVRSRRTAVAVGAAGGVTLVGVLMTAGCFLVGCCGSPMLGVYAGIFGAKALGAGKPLMALITLLSVGCGYYCLSRRFAEGNGLDSCCSTRITSG